MLALGVWLLCASVTAAQADLPSAPVRLRITWGGGEAVRWRGQIALDQGTLSELRVANLHADASGSIWLEDDCVQINSLSDHELDAVEVTAPAAIQSKLLIQLFAPASSAPILAEIPLSDLGREPYHLKLDEHGNALKVEISARNALRIVTDRQSLIFSPGERFAFELRPSLPDAVPGTTLDINTSLATGRVSEILWSDHQSIAVPVDGNPTLVVSVPLPNAEGVYTVRVAASQPPGFRDRFFPGGAAPLAARSFELVVIDPVTTPSTQSAAWEEVLTIDPTNPRWWERSPAWTHLRGIPSFKRGALGSTRAAAIDLPLGRFIELPPTVAGNEPNWQAYSLPLEAAGVPHVLEIDYPADEQQSFALSLLEPNSFGVAEGTAIGSGAFVEGLGLSEEKTHQTHKLVFWPRTQAPLLLLTNQHPTAPAHFGSIRVFKRTSDKLADSTPYPSPGNRLVAAYIARPLTDKFGVEQTLPLRRRAANPFQTADWQALYSSTSRLVDYLQFAGYNSAVIAVSGAGQALMPKLDSERMAGPAADRSSDEFPEPDGLELMLRAFERKQLTLVPALQLADPLPELEELRRKSNPQTSGLEWVGPNGQTWLERFGTKQGRAPYYNLLDPRVQQAILQSVNHFLDRYAHHPALGGLAIQLSSHGYAQLPPLEWGLDDVTIGRFERETGLAIDATDSNRFAARYALLNGNKGKYATEWRAWRVQQVAEFYGQLAKLVRAKNNRGRLILTTEQSFDHPELTAYVLPNILEPKVDATLLDLGVDRQQLEKNPGVIVCPTHYVEPTLPLQDHAVQLEINEAFAALRQVPNSTISAAVLYHRSQPLAVASLVSKSPLPIDRNFQMSCQPLAHGTSARQPYAMLLADGDCPVVLDGGECLPLGQEDVLRATRTILQRLPTSAQINEVNQQPVLVRTYAESQMVTVLVVNTCPWSTEARIKFDLPRPVVLEPLVAPNENDAVTPATPTMLAPGGPPWALQLEPYGIQAVRIAAAGAKVAAVEVRVSNAARIELAARLAELNNRDTDPHIYQPLANPSFEPLPEQPLLTGWRLLANPGVATAELDGTIPQDETTCLHLRSNGPLAIIESDSFPTPPTGQFALTVLLRGRNLAPGTELHMVLQTDGDRPNYRRSRIVGGHRPEPETLQDEWRPYAILVKDLPLESQSQMRVRFELVGPGELWIDDAKAYDLLFPLKFYSNKEPEWVVFRRLIGAAEYHYEHGQVTDCLRYMDGYWPRFYTTYTPPRDQSQIARQPIPSHEAEELEPASQPPPAENPGFAEKFWRLFRR